MHKYSIIIREELLNHNIDVYFTFVSKSFPMWLRQFLLHPGTYGFPLLHSNTWYI